MSPGKSSRRPAPTVFDPVSWTSTTLAVEWAGLEAAAAEVTAAPAIPAATKLRDLRLLCEARARHERAISIVLNLRPPS